MTVPNIFIELCDKIAVDCADRFETPLFLKISL